MKNILLNTNYALKGKQKRKMNGKGKDYMSLSSPI